MAGIIMVFSATDYISCSLFLEDIVIIILI